MPKAKNKKYQVQEMNLSDLIPADYNPRQISDKALKGLQSSLKEFECVEFPVWNKRTGRLVGGHQRVKAMLANGETRADVVVVDLPETKEKALNVALNSPTIQGTFTADINTLIEEIRIDNLEIFSDLRFSELIAEEKALSTTSQIGAMEYKIVIECATESEQRLLLDKLEQEGISCRALIS